MSTSLMKTIFILAPHCFQYMHVFESVVWNPDVQNNKSQ
jgi:hypothetical protein